MTETLFTTKELAAMLQVGTTTIKRWTDEGNLRCFRTPGGHRKVRAEDVYDFLQRFNYPIPIQRFYDAVSTDDSVMRLMVREKDFQTFISVCFSGTLKGKKDEVRNLFHELYQTNLPLSVIFDEILRPTLRRLADIKAHKINSAEFQLALSVLNSAIDKFNDSIIKPTADTEEVVLCLSAGNSYVEVELKALQTLFESMGKNVIMLMPRIETDISFELISVKSPKYVCLWVSKSEVGPALDERVQRVFAIVHEYGGSVILGGETQLVNAAEQFIEGRDILCQTFAQIAGAFPSQASQRKEPVNRELLQIMQ